MKIKYFGTAAYEGIPAMFCQCESCRRALALGGKNLRTRAQALIDDEVLVDFNADTVAHYQKYKFDWTKIKYCLITHSHSDHFYPRDLSMFVGRYYTHNVPHIDFYGAKSVYDKIEEIIHDESLCPDPTRLTATEVKPGDLLTLNGYKVVAADADHDPEATPVIYGIENKEGKRLLYAHDTGCFTDKVIADLKKLGRFDFVSLDCTGSFNPEGWEHGHMSFRTDALMKDWLIKEGLADEKTIFVVNHFSHNAFFGHDHEELCAEAAKYGFVVSYDGLEIEF